jgi:hypothetical protein
MTRKRSELAKRTRVLYEITRQKDQEIQDAFLSPVISHDYLSLAGPIRPLCQTIGGTLPDTGSTGRPRALAAQRLGYARAPATPVSAPVPPII